MIGQIVIFIMQDCCLAPKEIFEAIDLYDELRAQILEEENIRNT